MPSAPDAFSMPASDAGVGALCARAAVRGAWLNVRINVGDLKDEAERAAYLERADALRRRADAAEAAILALVEANL